jgi:hypothetical protein
VALVSIPGYFESLERNAVIALGVVMLICVPRVIVPGALARAAAVLAASSLYIYLVHWEVWPLFHGWYGLPSLIGSLAAGIAMWLAASHVPGAISGVRRWMGALPGASGRTLRGASEWRQQ